MLCNPFCCESHGEERGGIIFRQPWIWPRLEAAHGKNAHRLRSSGDDDLLGAGANAHVRLGDCFQARGAQAVDGHAGNIDGELCAQSRHAGHVPTGLSFLLGATEDYVFDLGPIETFCAVESARDREGSQIIRARGGEGAFWGATDGRANGADENGFRHDLLLVRDATMTSKN